jgi:hypothetical protein
MALNNKTMVMKYFVEEQDDNWKCRCGKARKKGQGWSNLVDHITRCHADTTEAAKQSDTPIDNFFRKKDTNLFKWLKWIAEDLPFNFCEKPNVPMHCRLEPVSN